MLKKVADLFVPDDKSHESALARTRTLGIGAHQDDLEILALHGLMSRDHTFGGVILTDGRGSPRAGAFAQKSDEEIAALRILEQRRAAVLGKYSFVSQLGLSSAALKKGDRGPAVEALLELFHACKPDVIYTHSPTDQHDTHVAVLWSVLKALEKLPFGDRPRSVLGVEVWGSLDWIPTAHVTTLDVSGSEALGVQLLRCFETQLAGGKRYELAALGRRRANATFRESHQTDSSTSQILALELAPFIGRPDELLNWIRKLHKDFADSVLARLERLR